MSAQHEFDDGEVREMYGPRPAGSIVFTSDCRMTAILTKGSRSQDASTDEFFNSMMSYSGRFKLNGAEVITVVDDAWVPNWVGSEQRRYVTLENNRLFIRTDKHDNHPLYPNKPVVGLLVWRKDAPF